MGLDVYLYAATDAAQNKAYYEACAVWYGDNLPEGEESPYGRATEEERQAWDAEHSYAAHADVRSERYPDHLFNRRYLRSSYNDGGFNHAVPEMLGTGGQKEYPNERGSLYWIFEPMGREWDGDAGELWPDDIPKLEECKKRALSVADELRSCDRLRVHTVDANIFGPPPMHSADDALRIYREQIARHSPEDGSGYSTRDADIFGGSLTVLGAVAGTSVLKSPGVHLIYRAADEGFEFYIQSAEITAEFCDEAIALIQRDGTATISWSG